MDCKKEKVFNNYIIGTMKYHNNDSYSGEWKQGVPEGNGKSLKLVRNHVL